jgi:hypothetical protein
MLGTEVKSKFLALPSLYFPLCRLDAVVSVFIGQGNGVGIFRFVEGPMVGHDDRSGVFNCDCALGLTSKSNFAPYPVNL